MARTYKSFAQSYICKTHCECLGYLEGSTNGGLMEKVTIKAYAVKHKLSIFNVVKMLKSKKLKTVVEEEDGKEITYILLDEIIEKEIKKKIIPSSEKVKCTIEDEIKLLKAEVKLLKLEIEKLKIKT